MRSGIKTHLPRRFPLCYRFKNLPTLNAATPPFLLTSDVPAHDLLFRQSPSGDETAAATIADAVFFLFRVSSTPATLLLLSHLRRVPLGVLQSCCQPPFQPVLTSAGDQELRWQLLHRAANPPVSFVALVLYCRLLKHA